MKWYRWSLPLLALAVAAVPAPAQGVVVIGNPYLSGGSFNYTRVSRHSYLSLSAGNYGLYGYSAGVYASPFGYSRSVTIVQYAPPPVVIVPRTIVITDDDLPPRRDRDRDLDAPPADRPLPGRDAGDFKPLDPDNRNRAARPVPPALPPPKPEPPKKDEDLPPPPRPPLPEANPVAEHARLVGLGKEAFAAGEYGRAAQRFGQAAAALPNDATSHFLHAEALFALGKYHDSVDAISAGMALDPNWPLKKFAIAELYGPNNAAAYADQLRRLDDTRARFANDPVVLFLSAYHLWFDGRKDDAKAMFQRARPGAADPAVIDRFLKAKPDLVASAGR
jgi:hypothetical protein